MNQVSPQARGAAISDAAALGGRNGPSDPAVGKWRSTFALVLAGTLAFRFWLAAAFPFTPDEAYFYYWGLFPDYGYYEQPPMIGWWLAALLRFSSSEWLLRLPQTIAPALIACGMVDLLRRGNAVMAYAAATALLLCPPEIWNILITADTPLALFSFASGWAYVVALRRDRPCWYVLAGVLFGCAFLSKYLSVLLGLAYIVFAVASPRRERRLRGLLIIMGAAAPAFVLTAYWNYQHCWANIVFNLYNRNEDARLAWDTPLLYVASLMYVLSPVALWNLWRRRRKWWSWWIEPQSRLLFLCTAVPCAAFGAISLVKTIGLHWVLAFVPFFFLFLATAVSREEIARCVRFLSVLGAAHVVFFSATVALPLAFWKHTDIYAKVVFHTRPRQILAAIQPYRDYVLTGDGYSSAAILGYHLGRYVPAFAPGGPHGRQDDILADFRSYAGRDILIVNETPLQPGDYLPYFRSVDFRTIRIEGTDFFLALGHDFDFAAYRSKVLRQQLVYYYTIPAFLPQGRCYFCVRYFSTNTCPSR